MLNKEKLPLLVGILIPITLIILVFIYSFLPTLIIKPQYDFIYAKQDYDDSKIEVISGQLVISNNKYEYDDYYEDEYTRNSPEPEIYHYNISTSRSKRISFDEASSYKLLDDPMSPDGFTVGRLDSGGSFFPFYFSDSDYGIYLKGKGLKKKIHEDTYGIKFIGWIEK